MGNRNEVTAPITNSLELDNIELPPSSAEITNISQGCIASSLVNLTDDQIAGVRSAVPDVEADLSVAIDRIKKRRARMVIQKDNLLDLKDGIEGGAASISSLYLYASPAIRSCPSASQAARLSKEGSDIVHARLNEIEYQLELIEAADLVLGAQERDLSGAMTVLDEIMISLPR